jgi:hypothetical protein
MVLPKVLQDILTTVQENNSLKSWNIFQDRNGMINIKLKYEGHTESFNHDQPVCYRKKTSKQTQRDYIRTRTWQAKRLAVQTPENMDTQTNFEDPVEPVPADGDSILDISNISESSLNPDAPSFMPMHSNIETDPNVQDTVEKTTSTTNKDMSVQTVHPKWDYPGMRTRSMTNNMPEAIRDSDIDLSLHLTPEPAILPLPSPEKSMTLSPNLLQDTGAFQSDDNAAPSHNSPVSASVENSPGAMVATQSTELDMDPETLRNMKDKCDQILDILYKVNQDLAKG